MIINDFKALPRSLEVFAEARRWMPGGVARNGAFSQPHPVYFASGRGARVRDVDGNDYLDFNNCFTALIHGHTHPEITDAIARQLTLGTCFAGPTERELELARAICSRSPAMDAVRFVNSGSEAVMAAIKVARAHTRRRLVAKARGAYHGAYDYVEVSLGLKRLGENDSSPHALAAHRGVSQTALHDVVLIDFNDIDATRAVLEEHRDKLAAVIFDPMPNYCGLMPIDARYLYYLREVTSRCGALLISDEIVNFRLSYGGGLERYGVVADLYCLGKVIGGGTGIGAIAGARNLMALFDPSVGEPAVVQSGTFSGNPLSMVAGAKSLELLNAAALGKLNELGEHARNALAHALAHAPHETCVTGAGSLFRLHFRPGPILAPTDARPTPREAAALGRLLARLQDRGFLLTPTGMGCLSTPMVHSDVDELARAVRDVVAHPSFRA